MTVWTACIATIALFAAAAGAAPKAPPPEIDAGAPQGFCHQIKVLADKAPDCSSRETIVKSVTRGCTTNDEKAIAIYNFGRLAYYHRQYPNEKGGIAALKLINVYGWSLCGGQHSALSSLWVANEWKHRFTGWSNPGHTTIEVFYDDQWHYFDTFLKFYCWKKDANAPGGRTVASEADVAADRGLLFDNMVFDEGRKVWYFKGNQFEIIGDKANWQAPAFLVCGDGAEGVITGVKSRREGGPSGGWMGINHAENGYNTNINLGAGYSLELMWRPVEGAHWYSGRKMVPFHGCGDKEYRNSPAIGPILEPYRHIKFAEKDKELLNAQNRGARTFASGRLVFQPDLSGDAFLSSLAAKDNVKVAGGKLVPADPSKPGSITVYFESPYVMSRAYGKAAGVDTAEISFDGGKTFKPIDLADFSDAVGGKYDCLVKLTFAQAVIDLKLEAIVQHNRCALPYLSPGPNQVTVSVADPKALGDNKLVVTYAYALGARNVGYENLADAGAEVGRAHKAAWSDTPTVVQKVLAAKDLPATFDIPVPTPKDKFPVYPRMLFLRREVIAPGSKPMPLPEGAVEAKVADGQELKTLPNPFLVGIAIPPQKVERAKETRQVALKASHVVYRTNDGKVGEETFDNHFLKWRPKEPEAWVMLVGGTLGQLPAPRDIASANLCIPVTNAHANASTQVAAVALKKPFEAGKPYDFENFGEFLGTANIPKQAAAGPAKYHKIDITRAIKSLAGGQRKFNGLALRTVPNRAVDDGYIVRVDVSTTDPMYVELEVYKDK
ncbi:MAG TPA: hypothetical protein VFJ30_07275 [Phycisphaerae bacterium]|nr:hypothetical protein [Phycisphaerae bacterium]